MNLATASRRALLPLLFLLSACNKSSSTEAGGAASSEPAPIPGPPDDGKVKTEDVVVGDGATAQNGDTVKVLYVGKFLDGKEFDSSQKHGGSPYAFPLGAGRAIKGYDLGVVGMKVHGKRKLTVPPSLAYGARGVPGIIPSNSWLVFEVELLDVQPGGADGGADAGRPRDGG